MSNELVRIPFYGDELHAIEQDGKPWVVLKPMCEALGLEPTAQWRRIQRQAWARGCTAIMATQVAGQGREVFCLNLDIVPMWLATISTGRIADLAVRAKLERYQREAAAVLRAHFLRQSPSDPFTAICSLLAQVERQRKIDIARLGAELAETRALFIDFAKTVKDSGRRIVFNKGTRLTRARSRKSPAQLSIVGNGTKPA